MIQERLAVRLKRIAEHWRCDAEGASGSLARHCGRYRRFRVHRSPVSRKVLRLNADTAHPVAPSSLTLSQTANWRQLTVLLSSSQDGLSPVARTPQSSLVLGQSDDVQQCSWSPSEWQRQPILTGSRRSPLLHSGAPGTQFSLLHSPATTTSEPHRRCRRKD